MRQLFSNSAVTTAIVVLCMGCSPLLAEKHPAAPSRRSQSPRTERPPKLDKAQKNEQPLERLGKMTPADRKKALEKLPAERRRAIENRLEQYNKLTPEEKARFQRFNSLPPQRQQAVRQAIGGLTKLPPERQQVVRDELRQMQGLAPGAREARINSDEFREKYSPQEQQLIEQLRDIVPE